MKNFLSVAAVAGAVLVFTMCQKSEPTLESQANDPVESVELNTLSVGQQVAALATFQAYHAAQDIPRAYLHSHMASLSNEQAALYLSEVAAYGNIANPTQAEALAFIQSMGFSDQADFNAWVADVASKHNDLMNDPYFTGMSDQAIQDGVADGFDVLPPGFNPPVQYPAGYVDCIHGAELIRGAEFWACLIFKGGPADFIPMSLCLMAAQYDYASRVEGCKEEYGVSP